MDWGTFSCTWLLPGWIIPWTGGLSSENARQITVTKSLGPLSKVIAHTQLA